MKKNIYVSYSSEEIWANDRLCTYVDNWVVNPTKRIELKALINRGMVKNLDALEVLIEDSEQQYNFAVDAP